MLKGTTTANIYDAQYGKTSWRSIYKTILHIYTKGVTQTMALWVYTLCRAMGLLRRFGRTCCRHNYDDWIWLRWMLIGPKHPRQQMMLKPEYRLRSSKQFTVQAKRKQWERKRSRNCMQWNATSILSCTQSDVCFSTFGTVTLIPELRQNQSQSQVANAGRSVSQPVSVSVRLSTYLSGCRHQDFGLCLN